MPEFDGTCPVCFRPMAMGNRFCSLGCYRKHNTYSEEEIVKREEYYYAPKDKQTIIR